MYCTNQFEQYIQETEIEKEAGYRTNIILNETLKKTTTKNSSIILPKYLNPNLIYKSL